MARRRGGRGSRFAFRDDCGFENPLVTLSLLDVRRHFDRVSDRPHPPPGLRVRRGEARVSVLPRRTPPQHDPSRPPRSRVEIVSVFQPSEPPVDVAVPLVGTLLRLAPLSLGLAPLSLGPARLLLRPARLLLLAPHLRKICGALSPHLVHHGVDARNRIVLFARDRCQHIVCITPHRQLVLRPAFPQRIDLARPLERIKCITGNGPGGAFFVHDV